MTILEGLLFALLAILIVMAALALLILAITPLKRLSHEQKPLPTDNHQSTIDLKDDKDKTIAALIASIDYKQQTDKDIRLISIKEINQ